MSFFLFSRAQKRDSNSSRKFFNLNNKIIINDFKNNVNKNKEKFLNKEKNLEFLLLNESLISKEQSLDNVNYSSYNNNNILNELFDKFFILKNKKDININFLYNKKFILSKLNLIDKIKNNKYNYNF